MLLELVLPGIAGAATFPPVESEILQLLETETAGDAVELLQQLQHVFAGLKVSG